MHSLDPDFFSFGSAPVITALLEIHFSFFFSFLLPLPFFLPSSFPFLPPSLPSFSYLFPSFFLLLAMDISIKSFVGTVNIQLFIFP